MNESTAYQFTNSWFEENRPTWELLLRQIMPKKILEIGAYEGRCTCFLIDFLAESQPIEIDCVDTWEGGVEHDDSLMPLVEARFDHNVRLAVSDQRHAATVRKIRNRSAPALCQLVASGCAESYDLIYIDGSHQAADVLTDAVLAFMLLRVGGMIIFDDYLWSRQQVGQEDPLDMPKMAIDAFINLFQRRMKLLMDMPLRQIYAVKIGAELV